MKKIILILFLLYTKISFGQCEQFPSYKPSGGCCCESGVLYNHACNIDYLYNEINNIVPIDTSLYVKYSDSTYIYVTPNQLSNTVLTDGSRDYDTAAVQRFNAIRNTSTVSGDDHTILNNSTFNFVKLTDYQLTINDGVDDAFYADTSGYIIQQTSSTGTHNHAIGGKKNGVVVVDLTRYIEIDIDNVKYKLIIAQ